MSVNGKRNGITRADIKQAGLVAGVSPERADGIVDEVRSVVVRWREFAELAKVGDLQTRLIAKHLDLDR